MSATLDVRTPDGKTDGTVDLPDEIFDVHASIPLLHQVVVSQLAAGRQGTHATKTRSMRSGGSKKPYRQKGTGNARQGSIRAPQFKGGGIAHGPQPRDYSQRTPKKMKAKALFGALSDRVRAEQLHVVTHVVGVEKPSTKQGKAALRNWTDARKVLIVLDRGQEESSWLSLRNLQDVHLLDASQVNTYDVLNNDDVVFTKAAFDQFVSRASQQGSSATAAASSAEEA